MSAVSFLSLTAVFYLSTTTARCSTYNNPSADSGRPKISLSPGDPHSFSRPDICVIKNIDFDLAVDFKKKVITGTADLTVEKKQNDSGEVQLIVDTRELTIEKVTDQATGHELQYKLDANVQPFGSKLEISLPANVQKERTVSIQYRTSPTCSALQWLTPEQTAGKRNSYFFSQCKAIHARSLFPCQDTPAVKFTFTAKVKAPREMTILMSAARLEKEPVPGNASFLTHRFEQKVPIPSYLLAIVGGDLESRSIGPRSQVWSEQEFLDKAEYEFAEIENMLKTAELVLGKYEWGQYDLLVLPPTFRYGNVENPCLTFVTPTLLAGDKSLAAVVVHEISHSWTGNLVTSSTFQDFWLNEGWTTYAERAIVTGLSGGEDLRQYLASEGWRTLQETVQQLNKTNGISYTKLIPDLRGVDPDLVLSAVPSEKGFALLFYLEELLGGQDIMEAFLKAYIAYFKFQSISSQQWKDFLFSYFSQPDQLSKLEAVDWNAWFCAEGMPDIHPQFNTSFIKPCQELSSRWLAAADSNLSDFTAEDVMDFSPLQRQKFLSLLLESDTNVSSVKLEAMDRLYRLSSVMNSEIRFRWLRLGLRAQWTAAIPRALDFVTKQGRIRFVRPIYRALYQWEDARQKAIDNFMDHRHDMYKTTAEEVAKDLKLDH